VPADGQTDDYLMASFRGQPG